MVRTGRRTSCLFLVKMEGFVVKNLTFLSASLFLCVFASCASVSHYEKIDQEVFAGAYPEALQSIRASKDIAYQPKEKVLYYLDEGMLSHYAKEYKDSSTSLTLAERGIEAAATKSISLEVSSYLVNDTVQEYPGEDYEDIYLNIFNALNYWQAGSTEGALVEVRRIDNKIKFLSTKYGTVISNSQKAVLEKSEEIPYDPQLATIHFSNSALGQYLGMLFYRSAGKMDDARINRDQVKLSFANQPHMYGFPFPSSLEEDYSVPSGKARLNILSFTGLGPIKKEDSTRIQVTSENWIKIALPVLKKRESLVHRVEVGLDNGQIFTLDMIEDMAKVAEETFKQKAAFIYFKTVLRSITKTSSSIALDEASKKAESGDAALLMSVLSIGAQVYAEASEQADLRISRYFPAKALVGGISLDPGTYSFSVRYYGSAGSLLYEEKFSDIQVNLGELNLVESVCLR